MSYQIIRRIMFSIINISFAFFTCSEALAIKFHESFDDWDVYSMKQNGKLICYVVTQPIEKSDKDPKREAYIIVTKLNKTTYEFNAAISKALLKNQASLDVNQIKMNLFTKENLAWTENKESDSKLLQLMKSNSTLKLIWNSSTKKNNIDKYSLKGFSKALSRIDVVCQ
jgi:invasion protein IalB